MQDEWTPVNTDEADRFRKYYKMQRLVKLSCARYAYFSTGPHPMLKYNSHGKVWYGNPDYLTLRSNSLGSE